MSALAAVDNGGPGSVRGRALLVVDPLHPAISVFRLVGESYESSQIVGGEDLFETDVPFPVSFRPADLPRRD